MRASLLVRARELARELEESEEVAELRAAEAELVERGEGDAQALRRYQEARRRVEATTTAILNVLSAVLTGGPLGPAGCSACSLARGGVAAGAARAVAGATAATPAAQAEA
ncbi:MAG: hypothetical protein QJR14_06865 [Bacillota bacterium]|nr:hypothetical protein [Bacillota bacterium]